MKDYVTFSALPPHTHTVLILPGLEQKRNSLTTVIVYISYVVNATRGEILHHMYTKTHII